MSEWIENSYWILNGIETLVLVLLLFCVRWFTGRYIRTSGTGWTSQQRLRGLGYLRSGTFFVILFGLIYIWGEALHGFALSMFAIAFAVVFSVKETFMNLNGAFLRLQGHAYEIGDRITIKGYCGDVIDVSLLSTTIIQVGHGKNSLQCTGQKVVIPNSLLLTEPVTNESFLDNFSLISLLIPVDRCSDWKRAKEILLQVAKEECAPYIEQARLRVRALERSRSIDLPNIDPKVDIQIIKPDLLHLFLRVPAPSHSRGRIEQIVLTRYLELITEDRSI